MVVFVIFTNHWPITIMWKNKKGTLPVAQNNMIVQCAEIPLLPSAEQTLKMCFRRGCMVFEPTCANAQWALMDRFRSVRLSVTIPKVANNNSPEKNY